MRAMSEFRMVMTWRLRLSLDNAKSPLAPAHWRIHAVFAFQGSRVTSDAGLILARELEERLGLERAAASVSANLRSERRPPNNRRPTRCEPRSSRCPDDEHTQHHGIN